MPYICASMEKNSQIKTKTQICSKLVNHKNITPEKMTAFTVDYNSKFNQHRMICDMIKGKTVFKFLCFVMF